MSRDATKDGLKGEILNGLENSRERKSKDTVVLNRCDWGAGVSGFMDRGREDTPPWLP